MGKSTHAHTHTSTHLVPRVKKQEHRYTPRPGRHPRTVHLPDPSFFNCVFCCFRAWRFAFFGVFAWKIVMGGAQSVYWSRPGQQVSVVSATVHTRRRRLLLLYWIFSSYSARRGHISPPNDNRVSRSAHMLPSIVKSKRSRGLTASKDITRLASRRARISISPSNPDPHPSTTLGGRQ